MPTSVKRVHGRPAVIIPVLIVLAIFQLYKREFLIQAGLAEANWLVDTMAMVIVFGLGALFWVFTVMAMMRQYNPSGPGWSKYFEGYALTSLLMVGGSTLDMWSFARTGQPIQPLSGLAIVNLEIVAKAVQVCLFFIVAVSMTYHHSSNPPPLITPSRGGMI